MRKLSVTLIELIVVVAILSVLAAILVPAMSMVRKQSVATLCSTNLHSTGVLIHSFINAHDDYAAPVVRQRDFWWDRGKRIGWDIQTGLWAGVIGGVGTTWTCPLQLTPYIGNARALGVDNSEALQNGPVNRVGPRRWHEPARLVLCYDVQYNLLDEPFPYANALEPGVGDLSDEMVLPWVRDVPDPVQPLALDRYGPHDEGYGVLFADGHARVGRFPGASGGVIWSGQRWW